MSDQAGNDYKRKRERRDRAYLVASYLAGRGTAATETRLSRLREDHPDDYAAGKALHEATQSARRAGSA